jgi:hypothetical protein
VVRFRHAERDEYDEAEVPMKSFPRSGKKVRPKTAVKGKRYHCATCRKRSPKPVKTPAPWYCPKCLKEKEKIEQ